MSTLKFNYAKSKNMLILSVKGYEYLVFGDRMPNKKYFFLAVGSWAKIEDTLLKESIPYYKDFLAKAKIKQLGLTEDVSN